MKFSRKNFRKATKIGKFNKLEKIYVALFFLSIAAGMIYGIFNADYYKPLEEAGRLDLQKGENNFTIFYRNFLISLLDVVTAGVVGLYSNFITFSAISSFFYSKGMLWAILLVFFTYGIFELLGALVFGLIGVNFAQR